MGEVAVTLQIMPDGTEIDLNQLEKKVKKAINVESLKREPVAFGLESLRAITVIPDASGGTDKIEEKILALDGVQNVKVTDVRRLL